MSIDDGVILPSVDLDIHANEAMAGHTTFRIGGPAQWFVTVYSASELASAVRWASARGATIRVIGGGSNVLVADAGLRGLVIENRVAGCTARRKDSVVIAGCGAMLSDLAVWSIGRGLVGLEWAVGIPGTLGGAIVGNAGAFGGYVGNFVRSVVVMDATGARQTLPAADCQFAYRDSRFKRDHSGSGILVDAELALSPVEPGAADREASKYTSRRDASQPWAPCAGSVFKRTREHPAGWLVEQAGLKGSRVGAAQISLTHANFIVNMGGATASDVLQLIESARAAVLKHFGIELELELEYIF